MNAVTKRVNRLLPLSGFLPSQLRALASHPAPMPDELTDDEINKMAVWWADQQWGELSTVSDSQEWGF